MIKQTAYRFLPLSFVVLFQIGLYSLAYADQPKPVSPPATVYFSPAFPWQNDSWNFKPLASDDPNKLVVEGEIASLVSRYQKAGFAVIDTAPPVRLQTAVLSHLFPGCGFYMIGWNEHSPPGKHTAGLASSLHYCLAVSTDGKVTNLSGMNDAPGYGKFLVGNKISIKTTDDARMVWLAYCDIAIAPWHSRDIIQVSPTEWHLGMDISDYDKRTSYCKIITGPQQKIISAEYVIETIKK